MIKVVHIISDVNIGGAGRYLINLLRCFDPSRVQSVVICPQGGQLFHELQQLGVNIIPYPREKGDRSLDWSLLWRFYRILRDEKPQVVHTHASLVGRWAARLARVPVSVMTRHWSLSEVLPGQRLGHIKGMLRRIGMTGNALLSEAIIAVSQRLGEQLVAAGIPSQKVWVIHNGVVLDELPSPAKIDEPHFTSYSQVDQPPAALQTPVEAQSSLAPQLLDESHTARPQTPVVPQSLAESYSTIRSQPPVESQFQVASQLTFTPQGSNKTRTLSSSQEEEAVATSKSEKVDCQIDTDNNNPQQGQSGEQGDKRYRYIVGTKGRKKSNLKPRTIKGYKYIIGTVGRLEPEKGHQYFLQAASQVIQERTDTEFWLIGSGSKEEELKKQSRDLQIEEHCRFFGFRPDATALVQHFDLFVLSSLTEALPLVILEALARERPVVATRVGGVPEIIKHRENGWLVEPANAEELKEAITYLLDHPDEAQRLGKQGRKTIETKFNAQLMAQKTIDLYERLIRKKALSVFTR